MFAPILMSGLVSGLVYLTGETVVTYVKSRRSARKRRATLAAKRMAVRVARAELGPVYEPAPAFRPDAKKVRSIDIRLSDIRKGVHGTTFRDVLDAVADDR